IPYIYQISPCDEDLYALFKHNSELIRRDVSSSIRIDNQIKYSKGRKWTLKKLSEFEIEFNLIHDDDIPIFWENLTHVINKNHGVNPTHSLNEIIKLKNLFPKEIKLYAAIKNKDLISGVVVFET